MINVMIKIFPSWTSLTCVAIYHHHLLEDFVSFRLFVMQKHALYKNNLFNEACYLQTSFGTRISRTSIKLIFKQVLWSIQWPCLQVQCFIKTHSDWRFSYSLDHYFYIRLTTGSSFFHDLNNKHTTGREFLLFLAIGTWSHLYCNGGPCLLKVCILTVTNKANH